VAEETAPPPPPAGAPPAPAAPSAPPAAAAPPAPLPAALQVLHDVLGSGVLEVKGTAVPPIARLAPGSLIEGLTLLRDRPDLRFDFLSSVTAVHWPKRERPFDLVYHLYSTTKRQRIAVKIDLAEGEDAPTSCGLWPAANWHEREVFDLFGIRFSGHPDMTRILMPDDWVGHPLRKEYPLEGHERDHQQYREVGTAEHVYNYDKAKVRGFGWKKEVEKTGVGRG
jgi:NADH-quinone oxidoreductase subunit C